ncbi:hypothetical protein WR25_23566 isoform F [Diploscapter pachys]|uniref:Lipid-binding serum glycoprotein N-terminal domain-containing protein n=1 Tax=Diploscapter pachys TaxID=2018661 RepID=A0A2A2JF76_9BILA|nr:hypothetical protein WR25_23566 isoform C [Diploscapter pachys]PAV60380.1 hypothetical protein WR25_23566 isoform F [Diploscapter pachys]
MQRATAQLCGLILLLLMDIGDSMHLPASFFDNSGKEMTDDDDNDNSKRRPELSFTLQPKGLEHIMKKSLESIRHDLIQQTPLSLSTNYLDLEISLNDLRFAEFVLPELHIHTVSASRLSFKTSGGFVRLQGAYSAVYKTRRLGQFEAIFEDINAETTVHLLKEQQTLKITTAKCKFAIDQIYVNLTPKLPQQINDAIKNAIIAAYEKRACGSIENYVNSLGKKLKSVAEIVDFSSKDVNRNENSKSVQHDLIHYTVNEESVHLHWEHKTNRVPLGMTSKKPLKREYTLVEPSMITLSISDDYLNDRLNSLINSEEVKISLHKIDKVAELLSLNCKEQSIPCVGQLAKLPTAIDGTGNEFFVLLQLNDENMFRPLHLESISSPNSASRCNGRARRPPYAILHFLLHNCSQADTIRLIRHSTEVENQEIEHRSESRWTSLLSEQVRNRIYRDYKCQIFSEWSAKLDR